VGRLAEEFNRLMEEARPPLPTATIGGEYDARGTLLRYGERLFDEMVPRCDLCLTVSGTATLHVAGHGVPMIVVYRGSRFLWHLVGRWLVKTRTYSLVNLLNETREHIVPEIVPWFGSNRPVAEMAIEYLRHPQKLAEQREKLGRMVKKLDHPGASMKVARMALGMMEMRRVDKEEGQVVV
jgi:lipid-A-disaccharide synthase